MRKLWNTLIPPPQWRLPVIFVLGAFFSLVAYTLYVSNAVTYLSDDPKACVNCHIMAPQYATWTHSSHRENANCNDCHVPQDNVFRKYFFKAKDGLRHATLFTLRAEPQVIRIHEAGMKVVQENCNRCHSHQNEKVSTYGITLDDVEHGKGKLCWDCHREVPHGKVNSLSSTPNARVPLPESPVPEWLKAGLKEE
ncbi:cytochrome c nitrite reductase small subunit [Xanthovirga aplysinae]|uniref:cytochrome c nitrite reductase small subunit n=1 Tax=Xanthovirga aplysinae TaxID=2529853 RepID=UPI0012BD6D28|nr:cytochrome c nitrite reductase small subunit [Xanthovirga aplysinae]MTI31946.1 cytochrome c nitrite reductase small subunit [Xanthovirga aplysinae]